MDVQATPQREVLPSLTGIRGVAALWVVFFHLGGACASVFGIAALAHIPIVSSGWSGVDMFFVLSGFVLMHSHSKEFVQLRATPLLRFAKVRIARVYPVSAVVLVLIALLSIDHGFDAWYRLEHAANFTKMAFLKTALLATRWFLPGPRGEWNEPVWSLSAEILGYAAFPVLAWLLSRRSFVTALTVGSISLGALLVYQVTTHIELDDIAQRPAVIRMACCFIAGVAAARAYRVAPPRLAASGGYLSVVATLAIATSCLIPAMGVVLPLSYAALILSLAFRRGPIETILCTPWVQFLGRISFPLYLVHLMPLRWLGYRLQFAHASVAWSIVAILLYVALSIGLAALLHVSVERPSHRWGRRWSSSPAPAAPSPLVRVGSTANV